MKIRQVYNGTSQRKTLSRHPPSSIPTARRVLMASYKGKRNTTPARRWWWPGSLGFTIVAHAANWREDHLPIGTKHAPRDNGIPWEERRLTLDWASYFLARVMNLSLLMTTSDIEATTFDFNAVSNVRAHALAAKRTASVFPERCVIRGH